MVPILHRSSPLPYPLSLPHLDHNLSRYLDLRRLKKFDLNSVFKNPLSAAHK